MSKQRIELKITLDDKHQPIDLDALTPNAVDSLIIFLNVIKNISELTAKDGEEYKIQIQRGSGVVATELTKSHFDRIESELEEVLTENSANQEIVANWREVQKVIKENGLTYEVNFNNKPLIQRFKNKPNFRVRSKRDRSYYNLEFFEGELKAIGGVNPNFHLYAPDGQHVTISCTQEQTVKLRRYLYIQVKISAWKRPGHHYAEFCDLYLKSVNYDSFGTFWKTLSKKSNEEQMKDVYYKLKTFLDEKNYPLARKFMRMFAHKELYMGNLKTILIITKDLRSAPKMKIARDQIKQIYDSVMRPVA